MASLFNVSRSGFYEFVKRRKTAIEKYDPKFLKFIYDTWKDNDQNYGFLRL
ncbi:hypothetical protein LEP1GSC061_2430, partial [Leptospira wolffii serovar Khorat str. Khorat-H2]